ncbi:MAG: hypothetical protein FJ267_17890, partial [Planctomycetes bacterium]|nr:hypothetical protein [Planctomycetota bacterium]
MIVGVIAGTNYVNAVSQQVVENATTQSRVNSVNSIDVNKEVVAEKPFVEASTQLSERVAQSDPIPTPSTVESLVPPPTDVKTEQGQQNPTLTDTFGLRLSRDGLLSGRLKVVDSISHGEAIASELSVKFIQNG